MKTKKILQLFGLSIAIAFFLFLFLAVLRSTDPTLGIIGSLFGLTIFSVIFYGILFDKQWIY